MGCATVCVKSEVMLLEVHRTFPHFKEEPILKVVFLGASLRKMNTVSEKMSLKIGSLVLLKFGFHYKSFILNAPLVSCPIPVIGFGSVCRYTHSEQMTGIGQLTIGAFRINDL